MLSFFFFFFFITSRVRLIESAGGGCRCSPLREISCRGINRESLVFTAQSMAAVFIACECDYGYWSIDNDTMLLGVTWGEECVRRVCVCGWLREKESVRERVCVCVCPYVGACWPICRSSCMYVRLSVCARVCVCVCVCVINPAPAW